MPLYEYRCSKCAGVFEVIQKFSDEPLTVHNDCGGTLEKLISKSALMFKGSGFYITDYPKGGVGGAKPAASDGGGSGESKSSESKPGESKSGDSKSGEAKSSDSKPAEKTATKTESKPKSD